MPSHATQPASARAEPPARTRRDTLKLIGRHQLASLAATVVDFGTMVLAVELLHAPPAWATLGGASLGAITNFSLGRGFTFGARAGHFGGQAMRYAVISAASAALNAFGEFVAHDLLGVQYMAARLVVAICVSLAWNFPMQRYFVFRIRTNVT